MSIRLVIADDHPTFVHTIRTLLRREGFDIVGIAGDGDDAVRVCLAESPDVVLMDINMPGVDGISATEQLVGAAPHIGILILTMFEDDDSLVAALRAGARGYLVKGARHGEVVRAIEIVHQGGVVVGPSVARKLRVAVSNDAGGDGGSRDDSFGLTPREREVLAALSEGLDNRSIARQLHLGEKTVRNYVSVLFAKMHVSTRAEAVARARDAGYGA
jgi:DNA-binding NarL/FixJ family response regulator